MTAEPRTRTRLSAALVVLLVIPIGLFARSHRVGADPATAPGFFATYTGDTLWPILFFFFGRFARPRTDRWRLAAAVLTLTLMLEFGQLWQPPFLQWLRQQPGIGFILGNFFVWSDVACLLVGTGIAVIVDRMLLSFPAKA